MQQAEGWPGWFADALCVAAAALSVVLGALALARLAGAPRAAVREDLADPVQSPFSPLPFIVLMLLAATGLASHASGAAT